MPRWKKLLYALLAVASVAAVALLVVHFIREAQEPETCAEEVERVGGECIGISGAGYDFGTKEIGPVSKAIARENKRIADEPHVTVAMMLPLQSDRPEMRRQMRSDLQGAYLGQRQANEGEGEPPKIRLVLANPGEQYERQEQVVDELLRMADSSKEPLRAVTGFNLSLKTTEQAVERLTRKRIPVLASRISGDRIANDERDKTAERRFPGLARIIPTNHDAAQALADRSAESGGKDRKTILVYDTREDSYNKSLENAFRGIKEKGSSGPALSFESPAVNKEGSTGNYFADLANNICDTGADTVYFAGRTLHLKLFALKLAQMECENREYTVVSGSDAASLRKSMSEEDWVKLRGEGGEPKVKVQYAAPAHPEAWSTELDRWKKKWSADHDGRTPPKEALPHYLTEPADALKTLGKRIRTTREEDIAIGPVNLEDSRTMLVYDGLITIGKALHEAMPKKEKSLPRSRDVGNQWSLLKLRHRVPGTGGLICLTNGGNPYDKPAAVVELDPGTGKRGTLKFIGLGWPTGEPQPKPCAASDR